MKEEAKSIIIMIRIKPLKCAGIKIPNNETIVWRYLSLKKFLDLICREQLYLCRMDLFEDKMEGRVPLENLREKASSDDLSRIDEYVEKTRKEQFVSCWTMCPDESYVHWKTFSEKDYGIAIKSTVERLMLNFQKEKRPVYIGKVEYIAPNDKYIFWGNTYQFSFQKRKHFEQEQEVRILTDLSLKEQEDSSIANSPNMYIPVDVKTLIEEIRLVPGADENLKNAIELLLKNKGLKIPVYFSKI